ncbi:hypothetical protein AB7M26_004081 [Pseudomonas sp. F-14 TE3482]
MQLILYACPYNDRRGNFFSVCLELPTYFEFSISSTRHCCSSISFLEKANWSSLTRSRSPKRRAAGRNVCKCPLPGSAINTVFIDGSFPQHCSVSHLGDSDPPAHTAHFLDGEEVLRLQFPSRKTALPSGPLQNGRSGNNWLECFSSLALSRSSPARCAPLPSRVRACQGENRIACIIVPLNIRCDLLPIHTIGEPQASVPEDCVAYVR